MTAINVNKRYLLFRIKCSSRQGDMRGIPTRLMQSLQVLEIFAVKSSHVLSKSSLYRCLTRTYCTASLPNTFTSTHEKNVQTISHATNFGKSEHPINLCYSRCRRAGPDRIRKFRTYLCECLTHTIGTEYRNHGIHITCTKLRNEFHRLLCYG
jgi:hypothetical protein